MLSDSLSALTATKAEHTQDPLILNIEQMLFELEHKRYVCLYDFGWADRKKGIPVLTLSGLQMAPKPNGSQKLAFMEINEGHISLGQCATVFLAIEHRAREMGLSIEE